MSEAMDNLTGFNAQSRILMSALADMVGQHRHEFRKAPGREFIDRDEAMHNVMRAREAYDGLAAIALPLLRAAAISAGNAGVQEKRNG